MWANSNTIFLTRKELYDEIWSVPVSVLAKKYGLSDVWIAKICRKHDIPRPPRGYWAQKYAGYPVTQTPLPKKANECKIEIRTKPLEHSVLREKRTFIRAVGLAKQRAKVPIVPDNLSNPHPLVESSMKVLASYKSDSDGLIMPPTEDCLDIHVTKDSLQRAFRVLDTLIKFLADKGFEVALSGGKTTVKIDNISLGISIVEELTRKRLKAKNHKLEGYYEFGYRLFKNKARPSGRLFLAIHDEKGLVRIGHHDTESTRLETTLRRFVTALARVVARKRVQASQSDSL